MKEHRYVNGHVERRMPDTGEFLSFDTVEEYHHEYEKVKAYMNYASSSCVNDGKEICEFLNNLQ